MTTAIKRRRGTTTQHTTFTGLEGELTIDTTKDTVVVHDGSTAGGFALLREDLSNNTNVITTSNTKTLTNKTFGDNPTFSGGTANGVAYLNGSKVLTTGSALTFDGTNLGIGVTPSSKLDLGGTTSSTEQIRFSMGGNVAWIGSVGSGVADGLGNLTFWTRDGSSAVVRYQIDGGGQSIWSVAGSERMRLTSTGLGVGTSSPSARLHVVSGQSSVPDFVVQGAGPNQGWLGFGTVNGYGIQGGADYLSLIFRTNTAERMRINSSGNVGIGDTSPSVKLTVAQGKGTDYGKVLKLVTEASLGAGTDGPQIHFLNSGVAQWGMGMPPGDSSDFAWFSGASDTGFGSERMRIDSSGNLGLGVTPSAWSYRAIEVGYIGNGWFGTQAGQSILTANSYYNAGFKYANSSVASAQYRMDAGTHSWYTAPSGTAGSAISFTQAMTLSSAGELFINESSPGYNAANRGLIEVNGTSSALFGLRVGSVNKGYLFHDATNLYLSNDANGFLSFSTNSTERMRIDSSGNLLVGTTTLNAVDGVSITPGYILFNTSATSNTPVYFRYNGTTVGSINTTTTTTTYATSSDYRLKENIQPMQDALAVVAQLNPVTYIWKADGSDGQGFIAHELQAVVPDCVTGEKDAVDAEGKPVYQGIDTSFLVATLTKAIQEQQEQINQLKAEVAALKGA